MAGPSRKPARTGEGSTLTHWQTSSSTLGWWILSGVMERNRACEPSPLLPFLLAFQMPQDPCFLRRMVPATDTCQSLAAVQAFCGAA